MKHITLICLFMFVVLIPAFCQSSKDYRIFGKITTVENTEITGYIAWGSQKLYWTDIFEASKPQNPYRQYFNSGDRVKFYNDNMETYTPPTHIFTCRFGNIKQIRPTGYNKIELQIRDGNSIELSRGNYYDIGKALSVYTQAKESITVKWEKISTIEFMTANEDIDDSYNTPIAGIVKTNQGIYKGLVTWDKDEKTLKSPLDGRTNKGNVSVPFSSVRKIIKRNNSCEVVLQGGQTQEMWGSNDVDNQNRGIIVNMPNIGIVSIPWRNFEIFESVSPDEINLLGYADFENQQRLSGEVITRKGEKIAGIIAYDLDESMNFEILEGMNDNMSYEIPFRYIKSIEPKNYKYSLITLTNGSALSLGDSVDVDYRNSGVIVFRNNENPVYIPWKEITLISF